MRTEWIAYLDDISKTHSITQTAQRFFISQQALSFAIKKLEEEFDAVFLNRTNHGATLTPEGDNFLKKARHIIDICHDLKHDYETMPLLSPEEEAHPSGKIRVLAHTRVLEPLLVDIIEKYARRYPDVQVVLNEMENVDILEAVAAHEADVGVIFVPEPFLNEMENREPRHIALHRLYSDDFILCCNRNHPFAQAKQVSFEKISACPTLTYDTNEKMLPAGHVGDFSDVQENIFFSNNTSFHKEMLRRGLAVSVITSFEFRKLYLRYKDLTAIPIEDTFKSTVSLVTSTEENRSVATRLFENMLLNHDFYGMQ